MKLIRNVILLLGLFILAGCSVLSPVKGHPANKYFINKIPDYVPVKRTRPIVLLVSLPEIRPAYNTTQMAYSIRPYEISYYALNQWAEVPNEMLQPLLVRTMEKTHHFKAVATPPYNGRYDYVLDTEILELLQDYTHCAPFVVMTVRVQILKVATNRVIGTRQFTVVQPMAQRTPYAGVYAANHATAGILERVAEYTLRRI